MLKEGRKCKEKGSEGEWWEGGEAGIEVLGVECGEARKSEW